MPKAKREAVVDGGRSIYQATRPAGTSPHHPMLGSRQGSGQHDKGKPLTRPWKQRQIESRGERA